MSERACGFESHLPYQNYLAINLTILRDLIFYRQNGNIYLYYGAVAQLGERSTCNAEVGISSIPGSTRFNEKGSVVVWVNQRPRKTRAYCCEATSACG